MATAMGMALSRQAVISHHPGGFEARPRRGCRASTARPTAYNLGWALEQQAAKIYNEPGDVDGDPRPAQKPLPGFLDEDVAMCVAMGEHAAPLFPKGARISRLQCRGSLPPVMYGAGCDPFGVQTPDPSIRVISPTRPGRSCREPG